MYTLQNAATALPPALTSDDNHMPRYEICTAVVQHTKGVTVEDAHRV